MQVAQSRLVVTQSSSEFGGSNPSRRTYNERMRGKGWKWVHFVFIFVFSAIWIAAALTGWISSVTFVSHVSMVALVYAAASAWQAAKAEQAQDQDRDEKNNN